MGRLSVRVALAGAVLAGVIALAVVPAWGDSGPTPYFAAGDVSVASAVSSGTVVEFWGAQWAKDNTVSGGGAPNAFKGFAVSVTPDFQGACTGTFTTRPGNSSAPPNSLGSSVQVLVVTNVTKSGPVISGTFTDIATVIPDPGYAGNPGHAGTGTVSSLCTGGGTPG